MEHHQTGIPAEQQAVSQHNVDKDWQRIIGPLSEEVQLSNAAHSYEEAVRLCREQANTIVAQCKIQNQKFTDPSFDQSVGFIPDEKYLLEHPPTCAHSLVHGHQRQNFREKPLDVNGAIDTLFDSRSSIAEKELLSVADLEHIVKPQVQDCSTLPAAVHRVSAVFKSPIWCSAEHAKDPASSDLALQQGLGLVRYRYNDSRIKQGDAGDCLFLTAVDTLCARPDLIAKICVFKNVTYGVFGFVFHRDPEWIWTVVDDQLYLKEPDFEHDRESTFDSSGQREQEHRERYQTGSKALLHAKCEEDHMWLPLLEKAFAKVHGDYEALDMGNVGEAVEDLTGGVTTQLVLGCIAVPDALWSELESRCGKDLLFVASTPREGYEGRPIHSLAPEHTYGILAARLVNDKAGKSHRLIKFRNPWGQNDELYGGGVWRGDWSNSSARWDDHMRKQLEHSPSDDGVFWMSFEDCLKNFRTLERTHVFHEVVQSRPDGAKDKGKQRTLDPQTWRLSKESAMVQVPYVPSYHDPPFQFSISEAREVTISLSQIDPRYFLGLDGKHSFTLAFELIKLDQNGVPMPVLNFRGSELRRSVSATLELQQGDYEVFIKVVASSNTFYDDAAPVEHVLRKYRRRSHYRLKLSQLCCNRDSAFARFADEGATWLMMPKLQRALAQGGERPEEDYSEVDDGRSSVSSDSRRTPTPDSERDRRDADQQKEARDDRSPSKERWNVWCGVCLRFFTQGEDVNLRLADFELDEDGARPPIARQPHHRGAARDPERDVGQPEPAQWQQRLPYHADAFNDGSRRRGGDDRGKNIAIARQAAQDPDDHLEWKKLITRPRLEKLEAEEEERKARHGREGAFWEERRVVRRKARRGREGASWKGTREVRPVV